MCYVHGLIDSCVTQILALQTACRGCGMVHSAGSPCICTARVIKSKHESKDNN